MDAKKEARRAYMREYYAANKEKFRPKSPEKRAEYNENRKRKYAADPEIQRKYRDAAKAWSDANPEKRKTQRVKKYGIDGSEYDAMLARQGGVCAICRSNHPGDKRGGSFHVDHCHRTGAVRGLLCLSCNHGIGKFKDSIEFLRSAIRYLESAQKRTSSD